MKQLCTSATTGASNCPGPITSKLILGQSKRPEEREFYLSAWRRKGTLVKPPVGTPDSGVQLCLSGRCCRRPKSLGTSGETNFARKRRYRMFSRTAYLTSIFST